MIQKDSGFLASKPLQFVATVFHWTGMNDCNIKWSNLLRNMLSMAAKPKLHA